MTFTIDIKISKRSYLLIGHKILTMYYKNIQSASVNLTIVQNRISKAQNNFQVWTKGEENINGRR